MRLPPKSRPIVRRVYKSKCPEVLAELFPGPDTTMTPPATHFDSDFSDDYPSKRSRADSYGHDSSDHDHTQIPPGAPEDSYSHRKTLPGRAAISNAADSIHFIKSRALVFHFVDIFDIVPDSLGKLESCILRCGICRKGNGWKWIKGGKGRGSTSNMIAHMRDKHGPIWQNALRADQAASGLIYAPETGSSTSDVQPLVTSNNEPVRTPSSHMHTQAFTHCMRSN